MSCQSDGYGKHEAGSRWPLKSITPICVLETCLAGARIVPRTSSLSRAVFVFSQQSS